MRILYHLPLDPFSRKIRIVLNEKKIKVELTVEQFWDRREGFLALNPAGTVPVLQEEDGAVIAPSLRQMASRITVKTVAPMLCSMRRATSTRS